MNIIKGRITQKFIISISNLLLLLISPHISYSQQWMNLSKNTYFTSMFEQGDNLWIGSYQGLVQYNKISDSYIYYDDTNSALKDKMIKKLGGDETKLYIQTWDGMIYIFENNKIAPIDDLNYYLNGANSTSMILNKYNGDIWFITFNGIVQYTTGEFILHEPDTSFYSGFAYSELFCDSQGKIWSASTNAVYCFDGFSWETFSGDDISDLSEVHVDGFNEDSEHRIWMHTWGKIISYDGSTFDSYSSPGIDITSCYIDENDKLWMSINYADFYTDSSRTGLFQIFDTHTLTWTDYDEDDISFENYHFDVIFPSNGGNTYMAGFSGLEKTDLLGGTYLGTISNSEIPANFIISLTTDSKNNIYFSCLGSFFHDPNTVPIIVKYNWSNFEELVSSDTFQFIFFQVDPLTDNLIIADNNAIYSFKDHALSKIADLPDEFATDNYSFYLDHNGKIWLKDFLLNYPGISTNKLFYYENGWIEQDISTIDPLNDGISDIFFDWNENPVLEINNELYRIQLGTGTIECITDDELADQYSVIKTICDVPGQKLFGSVNAINSVNTGIFDEISWEITPDTAMGFNGSSQFLLQLEDGNIWGCGAGGNYALSKYGNEVSRVERFNLQTNTEIWDFSADKNGNIFIATSNRGLYIFNENGVNPSSLIYSGENAQFLAGLDPTGAVLTIFNHNFEGTTINISVINLEGKIVYKSQPAISEVIYIPIDLSSHGIYLVHAENEQMSYGTVKFFK